MAATDLVFSQGPITTSPVNLVFGDDGIPVTTAELVVTLGGPVVAAYMADPHDSTLAITLGDPVVALESIEAHSSELSVVLGLPQVALDAVVFTEFIVEAELLVTLGGPTVLFKAAPPHDSELVVTLGLPAVIFEGEFDSQVQRPLVGHTDSPFQQGVRGVTTHASPFEVARMYETGVEARHDVAVSVETGSSISFDTGIRTSQEHSTSFQQAIRASARLSSAHQVATRLQLTRSASHQKALRLTALNCTAFHQVMLMHARPHISTAFQKAVRVTEDLSTSASTAVPVRKHGFLSPFQQAMKPLQGYFYLPYQPPPPHVCYTPPVGQVDLVFQALHNPSPDLVFTCDDQPFVFVIPTKRTYVMQNSVSLIRVSDSANIELFSATVTGNRDAWTWGFDARIPISEFSKVEPSGAGPVEVELTINGFAWRFLVEDCQDNRQFGENSFSVSGRSKTALLDLPYAKRHSLIQTLPMMSKALAEAVITDGGVSLGFDIDWDFVDVLGWQVPAETWAYQNLTNIRALKEIAESAGGYVQSHRTDPTLIIRSQYPVKSWEWESTSPDVQVPMDILLSRSMTWKGEPAYNSIFLSGEKNGYSSMAKIMGSAGDLEAPAYSHALLCDVPAMREYAKVAFSRSGNQAAMGITLPLGGITGLLSPGKLIEITGDENWFGFTRGLSVSVTASKNALDVVQSVDLERHYW